MWLLPTRGRPKLLQDTLNACRDSGMTAPLVIVIDTRAGDYPDLKLPDNVQEVIRAPWDMADCMRYVFWRYPLETAYGWIADDLIPHTEGWDRLLEMTAASYFLADCEDLFLTAADHSHSLCGAFCWGGDLVRTVGWWALPGVRQAGIDDAWCDICTYGIPALHRFRPDVLVEHLQWRNNKRPKDATDEWWREGDDYIARDFEILSDWRREKGELKAISQIKASIARAGLELVGGNLMLRQG